MNRPVKRQYVPVTVPFSATPAGEPPSLEDWANRDVWTDRMLATLQRGVQGGKWHTLIDKVFSPQNLFYASRKVTGKQTRAAGVDHQTVKDFETHSSQELKRLHDALWTDTYVPQAVRRVWIPKPGSSERRPLGVPTVRDRVVQTALLNVLEPIFDVTFSDQSYGFRHGRGCHHALERVEQMLDAGYVHVVDADLKSYFDTIPKDRLLALVGEKVSDSRVLRLVKMFLDQGVMEGLREWTPEAGTPQGAVISPLLANIYLNPLDHLLKEAGFVLVRYADDFVILCQTREAAERALEQVQDWVASNGLTLHPTKTKIVDAREESFAFLGYSFRGNLRFPREKSLQKFKDGIREKTRRKQGDNLLTICGRLRPQLQGWFNYFRHCHWTVYRDLDSWIRGRLRSILRKRTKRRGRGRGKDHVRWPNTFFDENGLYNLGSAHIRFAQSPGG
jgi:RNA-directed DNA polymerase